MQRVTHEEGATPQKDYSSFLTYTDRNWRTCVGMDTRGVRHGGRSEVGSGLTKQTLYT